MTEMSTELKEHIDMAFRTAVKEVLVEDGHAVGVVLENDEVIKAKKIVLAPGRDVLPG